MASASSAGRHAGCREGISVSAGVSLPCNLLPVACPLRAPGMAGYRPSKLSSRGEIFSAACTLQRHPVHLHPSTKDNIEGVTTQRADDQISRTVGSIFTSAGHGRCGFEVRTKPDRRVLRSDWASTCKTSRRVLPNYRIVQWWQQGIWRIYGYTLHTIEHY